MTTNEQVLTRARERAVEVAQALAADLTRTTVGLVDSLGEAIPELRGDQRMRDLLSASTLSNIETWLYVVAQDLRPEEVAPPEPALEYARRLAQRGVSVAPLLRAYRLGQRQVIDWAHAALVTREPDGPVALEAVRLFQEAGFGYVDRVAESVVAAYEQERERWLATWNTLRAGTLRALLDGEPVEVENAERTLGYRLAQRHVGVVAWADSASDGGATLQRLESVVAEVAAEAGATASPVFWPQDRSSAWCWLPMGHGTAPWTPAERPVRAAGGSVRLAFGSASPGVSGFAVSHAQALQAHRVATLAAPGTAMAGAAVVSYDDPAIRTTALVTADLAAGRDLVARALGTLADATSASARLRETLEVFLAEGSSYVATAERLHVHKNTVKYRVDKAVAARGHPLDVDRVNLEIALIASRVLGARVLPGPTRG